MATAWLRNFTAAWCCRQARLHSAQQQLPRMKTKRKDKEAADAGGPDCGASGFEHGRHGYDRRAGSGVQGDCRHHHRGSTEAQDATLAANGSILPDSGVKPATDPNEAPATARMFYVAYFKKDAVASHRPVMFLYNGGPGSATMWLHLGTFGPRRVVVPDTKHQEGAPYSVVENQYSLLDVCDLVFIDAPGTGLSRTFGKEKAKAFYGIDADGHAFARFIHRFLSKYDRWNSPKYLFGESYGTPRSAVLAADLRDVDLNGIVLLSQILSFDNSVDDPRWNPGVDQAYALALPTYAATAYYFHKLPTQPAALKPFLAEVEKFAIGEYMSALLKGSELADDEKRAVAEKLHGYTGLPVDYLVRSDLRVVGGDFSKALKLDEATTIGRLDTRFQGPDINPLSEGADYDPQSDCDQFGLDGGDQRISA